MRRLARCGDIFLDLGELEAAHCVHVYEGVPEHHVVAAVLGGNVELPPLCGDALPGCGDFAGDLLLLGGRHLLRGALGDSGGALLVHIGEDVPVPKLALVLNRQVVLLVGTQGLLFLRRALRDTQLGQVLQFAWGGLCGAKGVLREVQSCRVEGGVLLLQQVVREHPTLHEVDCWVGKGRHELPCPRGLYVRLRL